MIQDLPNMIAPPIPQAANDPTFPAANHPTVSLAMMVMLAPILSFHPQGSTAPSVQHCHFAGDEPQVRYDTYTTHPTLDLLTALAPPTALHSKPSEPPRVVEDGSDVTKKSASLEQIH